MFWQLQFSHAKSGWGRVYALLQFFEPRLNRSSLAKKDKSSIQWCFDGQKSRGLIQWWFNGQKSRGLRWLNHLPFATHSIICHLPLRFSLSITSFFQHHSFFAVSTRLRLGLLLFCSEWAGHKGLKHCLLCVFLSRKWKFSLRILWYIGSSHDWCHIGLFENRVITAPQNLMVHHHFSFSTVTKKGAYGIPPSLRRAQKNSEWDSSQTNRTCGIPPVDGILIVIIPSKMWRNRRRVEAASQRELPVGFPRRFWNQLDFFVSLTQKLTERPNQN